MLPRRVQSRGIISLNCFLFYYLFIYWLLVIRSRGNIQWIALLPIRLRDRPLDHQTSIKLSRSAFITNGLLYDEFSSANRKGIKMAIKYTAFLISAERHLFHQTTYFTSRYPLVAVSPFRAPLHFIWITEWRWTKPNKRRGKYKKLHFVWD